MIIEKKKSSVIYVMITYAVSLLSWGLLIINGWEVKENGTALANILYMVGGMSPAIVALLFPIFMIKGQRRAFYKRYFGVKIAFKWYVLAILPVSLMVGLSYGFMQIFFKDAAASLSIKPIYLLIPLFFGMILGGGLEELGWRGLLVHNLRKSDPLAISLVVGFIWLLWHLPLFLIKGTNQYHTSLIPFILFVLSISFITTILYVKTKSVVPCLIAHSLLNAFGDLGIYFGQSDLSAAIAYNLALLVTGLIVVFVISKLKPEPEECDDCGGLYDTLHSD